MSLNPSDTCAYSLVLPATLEFDRRVLPVPKRPAQADNFMESLLSSAIPLEPRVSRSVSLETAAELLGVSRRTIYNRIRDGRLQTVRTLGGSQRVLLDSVRDLRRQTLLSVDRDGATS
jgi:excisionase family DNA binding protein